jgi:hypothetical protein
MMVGFKLIAILIFVFAAIGFIHPSNWHPFMPNGWSGVLTGGSIIFFTYIGFDSVSTAAEECRNPQRDLPIGIIATLVVCTVLYVAVAVCLTGLVPWQSMVGDAAPVVNALKKLSLLPGGHPLYWIRLVVLLGALMGMISSILVYQIGQSRVWFSMSRDGLLPKVFSNVHPSFARRHFPPGSPASSSPFHPASSTSALSPTFPTSARFSPSYSFPSASSSSAFATPTAAAVSSFPSVPSSPLSASSSASCSWPDCPSSPGTASSSGWSSACSSTSSIAVTAPNSHQRIRANSCHPKHSELHRFGNVILSDRSAAEGVEGPAVALDFRVRQKYKSPNL